jgi:putative sulfotransferase
MLAENGSLLMIFELFSGLDITRRLSPVSLDGREFAALISEETPAVTMAMRRGYEIAEVAYPFGAHTRYKRDQGLPWILTAALARLTDDPDPLFDETVAFVSSLPHQHLSSHYRQLFDWLSQRMGRKFWIEKSGSSIEYLGSLHDFFPNARFLHLHREGPETALSMREHHIYRLWVSLMYGSLDEVGLTNADLAELDRRIPPGSEDPIQQLLETKPPVEYFGRYWSDLVIQGFRALSRLNADQYLELRFEDVVSKPKQTLRVICDFFELDTEHDDWIDRAAGLVRGIPPTRFDKLPAEEQARLSEACRAVQQLLGQIR